MNTLLMSLIFTTMTYEMPKLPYANNALEPVISKPSITIMVNIFKHM